MSYGRQITILLFLARLKCILPPRGEYFKLLNVYLMQICIENALVSPTYRVRLEAIQNFNISRLNFLIVLVQGEKKKQMLIHM